MIELRNLNPDLIISYTTRFNAFLNFSQGIFIIFLYIEKKFTIIVIIIRKFFII